MSIRRMRLWVLMPLRRLGFGRSPLRRRSDRIEIALLWCALIAALVMLPVSGAAGTGISHSLESSSAHRRAVLHDVPALTLQATESALPDTPGSPLTLTQVSYVDPQGVARTGMASVVIGTPAGAALTVWLDSAGNIVSTPRSPSDNEAFGTLAGFLVAGGSWLLLWGLFRLARVPLDRGRVRAWDADWYAVAPR
ncbi:Rv1733c family protein [Kribbella sp. WER1]